MARRTRPQPSPKTKRIAIFCGLVFGSFLAVLPPQGHAHDERARQALAARMRSDDVARWGQAVTITTADGGCVKVVGDDHVQPCGQ